MSIQNEIDRITNNVAEAYAAVEEKGGSVPEEANSDKLAEAINTIPEPEGIPVKPITEAEYSALSDEDKNGETAWLVTDAEGSSGNGDDESDSDGGEIYSTEEVRIGTWINGKPLYRRVITVFNISGTSTPTVITVYNMPGLRDVLFGGELERVEQNTNWIWPVTIGVDGTYVSPRYNKVTGDIMMDWLFGNPDIVYDLYLIIEYTKTTD